MLELLSMTSSVRLAQSVGPVMLGMSRSDAATLVSASGLEAKRGAELWWVGHQISIGFGLDDRVAKLAVEGAFEGRTEEGLGIGDPAAYVEEAFEDLRFDEEFLYFRRDGVLVLFQCSGTVLGFDRLGGLTIERIESTVEA